MGFERFGKVSFTVETKAADFVKYLEEGKIMATRCKKCGMSFFPPRMDCYNCLSSEAEWFELKDEGKLLTYTTANYAPTGFEDEVPYTLAVVQFENGLKLFGRLSKEIKVEEIRVGLKLKVAPLKLGEEKITYHLVKT